MGIIVFLLVGLIKQVNQVLLEQKLNLILIRIFMVKKQQRREFS
jgi:hypothetical protein